MLSFNVCFYLKAEQKRHGKIAGSLRARLLGSLEFPDLNSGPASPTTLLSYRTSSPDLLVSARNAIPGLEMFHQKQRVSANGLSQ